MTATTDTTDTRTEKGISLARGPALALGTVLLAAGLYFLYKQHGFPPLSKFPNGKAPVDGKVFLGIFGANGWTGMLTAVAGGLLLFGAAQHLLAKTMSLVVGVALGAAAIIALISGNVLGLAAANGPTKLGWGISAVILLFNTVVPRRRKTVETVDQTAGNRERPTYAASAGTGAVAGAATTRDRDAATTGDPGAATGDRGATTGDPGAAAGDRGATTGDPGAAAGDRGATTGDRGAATADRAAVTSRGDAPNENLVRPGGVAGAAAPAPASGATGDAHTSVMRDSGPEPTAPSEPGTRPGARPA